MFSNPNRPGILFTKNYHYISRPVMRAKDSFVVAVHLMLGKRFIAKTDQTAYEVEDVDKGRHKKARFSLLWGLLKPFLPVLSQMGASAVFLPGTVIADSALELLELLGGRLGQIAD